MITRKKVKPKQTKFSREYAVEVNGFTINANDIIKISGEYGRKFKFHSLVTNMETGVQWIDCLELHKGAAGAFYSYRADRIKRIPTKRGKRRKKNVSAE